MSRKAHNDAELRPPANALSALGAWLDANGLRRVALVEVLSSSQVHVSRLFAEGGYLSATQRRALEKFTGGTITVAALEGKAAPPAKVESKRRAPIEPRLREKGLLVLVLFVLTFAGYFAIGLTASAVTARTLRTPLDDAQLRQALFIQATAFAKTKLDIPVLKYALQPFAGAVVPRLGSLLDGYQAIAKLAADREMAMRPPASRRTDFLANRCMGMSPKGLWEERSPS